MNDLLVDTTEDESEGAERDIAIVGMSGRFPGARDLRQFWSNLADGVESIRTLSDEELLAAGTPRDLLARPDYVKAASWIDGAEDFDANFFGYNARDAEILDPQQRLFMEHAWSALEDAGTSPQRYPGTIGVYAGVAWNTYLLSNLMAHRNLFDGVGAFQIFITNDKDFMPTRVSYKLDLKGPSVIVQTSCSTSLVATHLACLALQNYECDMTLVGGVTVKVPRQAGYFYQEGGLASPDGHCRSFDSQAAGTVFGSGVGVVVLKRLDEAVADGDAIRAVIKGSAINNDGAVKASYTAPSMEGQADVIAAAQEMAGVDPATIRYVECHGTATSLGDPIEVRALDKVFRQSTQDRGFCALGSVKSNVGHLDAAAGVAGLIKTVLALENATIPPSLHYDRPNPAIDFAASPFYVAARREPWTLLGEAPRRAGVSSFGVGGTNAHAVLEEAPVREPGSASRPWHLLALSARTETALIAAAANLRDWLEHQESGIDLADVSYTLLHGRAVLRHRQILVCRNAAEAIEGLAAPTAGRGFSGADHEEPRTRPVAFLFSGQGSQYIGMGRQLYEREAVFRQAVDHSAAVLEPLLGEDIRRIIWPAPGDEETATAELGRTRFTQPALFLVEHALAKLWASWGVEPQALLGHSIGEYVAATLAGVFELDDALRLVATRGHLMDGLPAGSMLAVALPEEELAKLISDRPELAVAALNEASRTVVSGSEEAIDDLVTMLAERGVEGRRLHTSHAFHSPMMDPILEAFEGEVAKVARNTPRIPFVSNLTGTFITDDEAVDPAYWVRHLRQPVRFADSVATLCAAPERVLLEVGPGRALATLALRHSARTPQQPVLTSLRHPQTEEDDQSHMLAAYGRLWIAGVELDPAALTANERRLKIPLPTYPFERQRYWIEAGTAQASDRPSPEAGLRQKPDIADWFYLPAWKPTLPPRLDTDRLANRWLVLALPGGAAAPLVQRLRELGRQVTVVEPSDAYGRREDNAYTVDPENPSGWQDLVAELGRCDLLPDAIVHAWTWTGGAEEPADDRIAVGLTRGFRSLLDLLLALQSKITELSNVDVTILADGLKSVAADEPVRPGKAPLLGLVRVVPEELPGSRCRLVDSPPPATEEAAAELAERLLAEITSGAEDEVVALRGSQRLIEAFEPVSLAETDPPPLRQNGVYLLTGGLQGNGYAIAGFLASSRQARLILLEPDEPTPGGSRQARLEALESRGAKVLVAVADLRDNASVRRAVEQGEQHFGPLQGVFHTVGTVGESTFRPLTEIDAAHLDDHFSPKIEATVNLEAALESSPRPQLEFCLLLSSLASVLGGLAYGGYCAANQFLDAFARDRRQRGTLPWRSVGWDVWQLEDETEQITSLRADLAELAMTPQQGEQALARLLAWDLPEILVSTGALEARLVDRRRRIASHQESTTAKAGPRHPRPELPTPYAPLETELERRIAEVWSEFLGFEPIGAHDNFFELGGDSFIAVRVAARLREALERDLPVAQLYQQLTVRSMAELLERETEQAGEERTAQLSERRESAERRKEMLERRRANKRRRQTLEV